MHRGVLGFERGQLLLRIHARMHLRIADDDALQMRVNELHTLIQGNYIQPETKNLLTRLSMAGKPIYVTGVRETPSIEDASLCGGMYLDSLVQRYEVTRKPGAAAPPIYRGDGSL